MSRLGFFCFGLSIWAYGVLFAEPIETFYGVIEVEEPVLLELIQSPAFERLRSIHQYGVSYYTTHPEEYTRHAHSLGVFALLRMKGASLGEQIAGLLHDVSHTVFSHVGDWLFGKENQEEDYQNSIHANFLENSGLAAILERHGFKVAEVLPKRECFIALEQPLPNLSADRIDYNIQGAYFQNYLTHEEAMELVDDLCFIEGMWVATRIDLMEKLARYSLFMTQDCWGSPENYLCSRWLADALLRSLELGMITYEDIHFSTDDSIWEKLICSEDPFVQGRMEKISRASSLYRLVNSGSGDILVRSKFRGIDPWIISEGKTLRLTSLLPELGQEHQALKRKMAQGWAIEFLEPAINEL